MWDELGIAPCHDAKAIRRAYAARLKKLDPDRDPEAFARLRYALQWALDGGDDDRVDDELTCRLAAARRTAMPRPGRARARSRRRITASPRPCLPRCRRRRASSAPELPPPDSPSDRDDIRDRALLIALDAALRRHDATQATTLYYRAAATGALSLENAPDVVERLHCGGGRRQGARRRQPSRPDPHAGPGRAGVPRPGPIRAAAAPAGAPAGGGLVRRSAGHGDAAQRPHRAAPRQDRPAAARAHRQALASARRQDGAQELARSIQGSMRPGCRIASIRRGSRSWTAGCGGGRWSRCRSSA